MSAAITSLGGGLYEWLSQAGKSFRPRKFAHRPKVRSRTGRLQRILRVLRATTEPKARDEMAALRTLQNESRFNPAADPYAKPITVKMAAKEWLAMDCPRRKGKKRTGLNLKEEKRRMAKILEFWADVELPCCGARKLQQGYYAKRLAERRGEKYRMDATVDRELQTLSNLLEWAVRWDHIHTNPLRRRERFDDSDAVRHCTAVRPTSDDQFHQIAAYLLARDRSRALGWQFLLEGLSGARTCEILACRVDAKPGMPGHQTEKTMVLHRAKKGIKPWVLLEASPGHDPLRECLLAHRIWHKKNHPKSPWFFPGLDNKNPVAVKSLTKAIGAACEALGFQHMSSHGLRAYYVATLRSLGIDDSEIAKRLGHRSGVMLVEKTYGESDPGWFGAGEQDFLPTGLPAWWSYLPKSYQKVTAPIEKFKDRSKQNAERNRVGIAGNIEETGIMSKSQQN